MNKQHLLLPCALAIAAACGTAAAAPLDAMLTADQRPTPWAGELELSYDFLNSSLNFLHLQDDSTTTTNGVTTKTGVGDYKGAHLRGGIALSPRLWLDGAYWKRKIDYRSFDADINTWQVGAQYKMLDGGGYMPKLALRASAWGDSSDAMTKQTNTTVAGTKFTSATVTKPTDVQFALDLIGTWPVTAQTNISLFGGAARSRVSFDSVSATSRTKNGCEYNITFSPEGATGLLAHDCNAAVVVTRFFYPATTTVDAYREAKYTSAQYQFGASAAWHNQNWRLRAGYQYQSIKRDFVDDVIALRGDVAYKHNHTLVTDVSYNAYKNVVVFVRGQYMSNQFNGEIPMAYNSLTADKYGQHYGMVSIGASLDF